MTVFAAQRPPTQSYSTNSFGTGTGWYQGYATNTGTYTSATAGSWITVWGGSSTSARNITVAPGQLFVTGQPQTSWQQPAQPNPYVSQQRQALADPRILNKFLNASDLLAEFIAELGLAGASQGKALNIPIEWFINWLIVRAAEEDDKLEEVKDIPKLPGKVILFRPDRCRCCGKFISQAKRDQQLFFCSGAHFDKLLEKAA